MNQTQQKAYSKALEKFVQFLNDTVTYHEVIRPQTLTMYDRVVGAAKNEEGESAVCFVVKKDFRNRRLGEVRIGDILYPASYGLPARRVRGNIFSPSTYRNLFDRFGMKPLNAK